MSNERSVALIAFKLALDPTRATAAASYGMRRPEPPHRWVRPPNQWRHTNSKRARCDRPAGGPRRLWSATDLHRSGESRLFERLVSRDRNVVNGRWVRNPTPGSELLADEAQVVSRLEVGNPVVEEPDAVRLAKAIQFVEPDRSLA
jgi:hypothetical protein